MKEVTINWEPQERQLAALNACGLSGPFEENLKLRPSGSKGEPFHEAVATHIGYGGAAGGGKTDMMVAGALVASLAYPGINIGYFRRKFPQLLGLGGAIERSQAFYPKNTLANYHKTRHKWIFKNGSQVQFCHAQNPPDVEDYQSQQFDVLMIDETTQFTEGMIKWLITRNRATVNYDTFRSFTLLATNPGNVGHAYFKREFVDIGPPERIHDYENEDGKIEKHLFIPAKLKDNQILLEREPDYATKLSPNPKIRKRLLEGDWDIAEGSEFFEFRRVKHVLPDTAELTPSSKFPLYMGVDWGYSGKESHKGAFAVVFFSLIKMEGKDKHGEKKTFNRVVVFDELYGKRKASKEWANIVYDRYGNRDIHRVVGDPSMFEPNRASIDQTSNSQQMEEQWKDRNDGNKWVNMREGSRNREGRAANLHNWLRIAPDGRGYLVFTERCKHCIRTIPLLMTDESNERDVDTEGEDHLYDALTYALGKVKLVDLQPGSFSAKEKFKPVGLVEMTEEGKQKSIDLEKFESAWGKSQKDWKSI